MKIRQPILSVIICTYNGAKTIAKCLESLTQQTVSSESLEIIVIDNASSDSTKEIVMSFCHNHNNIKYHLENKVGLSSARNTGFREAKSEWICYIDDDAYADNNWCKRIISNIEKYSPKAIGGNVFPYYEKPKPFWFNDNLESVILGNKPTRLSGIRQISGFCGSNMCFSKDLLVKYNGFNEEFGMRGDNIGLGEDLELFFRMSKNNEYLFFDPSMIVYHYVPSHKYRLSYRFDRAKKNGIAISKLHKYSNGSPIRYSLIRFSYYLLSVPIAFIKKPKVSSIVLSIEKSITHFYSLRYSIIGF